MGNVLGVDVGNLISFNMNFLGCEDDISTLKNIYRVQIDHKFKSDAEKFQVVSAFIRGNPELNAAVGKYLPEDSSEMLMPDGYFD